MLCDGRQNCKNTLKMKKKTFTKLKYIVQVSFSAENGIGLEHQTT